VGIQILLGERNVFKNKTWGENSLKNYSDDQNNWEGYQMRKITKSTRSKYTVHHQKLQHVNNHKTQSFGKKPVTLFKNVKSVTQVFSTIILNMEWQMQ
jgi:hypothetical protein